MSDNACTVLTSARDAFGNVNGTVRVARTGKVYGFTLFASGECMLAHGTRSVAVSHLRDVRCYLRTRMAPIEAAPAPAPAMVPQPCQQAQAQARKPRLARGERRYVTVRASDTGEEFRVLTSVAGAGYAMIEDVPSNEHRAGAHRGMLLTHGAIRKAVVFASMDEGAAYAEQSRRKGWGHRYTPAAIVADPAPVEPAPAMVPQPCQQQQGKADAAAMFAAHLRAGKGSASWAEMDSVGRWAVWAKGKASHGSASCVAAFAVEADARALADRLRHDDAARASALDAADIMRNALRYEDVRNQDAAEPGYSNESDMVATVSKVIAAGWKFDGGAALTGDWPWYVRTCADDTSSVVRDGERRFYVESASEAEAVLETAEAVEDYESGNDGCPVSDPDCMGNNGDCHDACEAPARAISDDAFRAAAYAAHGREGEIECDDTATVSRGDEPGAFVAMWVWVSNDEARAHMPEAPAMVPQPVQQQQAQAGRRAGPGVILEGAPEILQDNGPADVAEILEAMEAYFGPHTVMRTPRAPFPPVPFVIDHVDPRWSLGALSGLYLAALGGITAGAIAYAILA